MGIRGLTTYLSSHTKDLAYKIQFAKDNPQKIVVDGWAFLYFVYPTASLEFLHGGSSQELSDAVETYIRGWADLGVTFVVVFDGPQPEARVATRLKREKSKVGSVNTLLRASKELRGYSKFSAQHFILPPLAYATTLKALKKLGVETRFVADEGDRYIVSVAVEVRGIIASKDSDFVMFDTDREYMQLSAPVSSADCYSAHQVASKFGLERAQLPLLACLLGNDIVMEDSCAILHKGRKYFNQRLGRSVAAINSVMDGEDPVEACVKTLVSDPNVDTQEVRETIKVALEAYVLGDLNDRCKILCASPSDSEMTKRAKDALDQAYKKGDLNPRLLEALEYGMYFNMQLIEEIQMATVHADTKLLRNELFAFLKRELGVERDIVEYIRRGTNLRPEKVDVPEISLTKGIIAADEDLRREALMNLTYSEGIEVEDEFLGLVLALRYLIVAHAQTAWRWSPHEIAAFVAGHLYTGPSLPSTYENRIVMRNAQYLSALESVTFLSQVLLIPIEPSYEGSVMHGILVASQIGNVPRELLDEEGKVVFDRLYELVMKGHDENVSRPTDFEKVLKKIGKKEKKTEVIQQTQKKSANPFAMLGGGDEQEDDEDDEDDDE